MSLVNAAVRPSGASYRDELLAKHKHNNPSKMIDELLSDNLGYLCIEGNQKVDTKRGFVPIKDVRVGDYVKTRSGFQKVLDSRKTGYKELLDLKFLGNHLLVTPEHKVLTDRGWVESKNLKAGDMVAYRLGDPIISSDINPNLAKIVGWLMGSGSIIEFGKIYFENKSLDINNALVKTIEDVSKDLECNIRCCKDESLLYQTRVRFKEEMTCEDKHPLMDSLRKMGLINRVAVDKFIPQEIMTSSIESQLSFLGAYTDANSKITANKNYVLITYTTASKQLAYDIQTMIRNLGFVASISEDSSEYDRAYHIVVKNAAEYLKNIKKYADTTAKPVDVETKYTYTNPINKISTNDNIIWTKVQEVSHHDSAYVYDITVENEHEFVCQGIVVHNCYQEDTIKFLQDICGLSGSDADNVRRAIGRKKKDVLEAALPRILEGYCNMSEQPRDIAEKEAKEFLQIIEDSSNYQFGYNHSTGYSMIGYVCAMLRYYHTKEFVASLINNADKQDDIVSATELARKRKIKICPAKFGYSKGMCTCDKREDKIYKGVGGIKNLNSDIADELYNLYQEYEPKDFLSVLLLIKEKEIKIDSRQIRILIRLNYFSDYGKPKNLLRMFDMFEFFKANNKTGFRKNISKESISNEMLYDIISRNSEKETEKKFTGLYVVDILKEIYQYIMDMKLDDFSFKEDIQFQIEHLGYVQETENSSDREYLYITDIKEARRKSDGKKFGYYFYTTSIGSGISSCFTVFSKTYNACGECKKNDIIKIHGYDRTAKNGKTYFTMKGYSRME